MPNDSSPRPSRTTPVPPAPNPADTALGQPAPSRKKSKAHTDHAYRSSHDRFFGSDLAESALDRNAAKEAAARKAEDPAVNWYDRLLAAFPLYRAASGPDLGKNHSPSK